MDNNGVVDILAGAPPAGISTTPVYPPARVASMVVDISPSHKAFLPMQPIVPPPAHLYAHLAVKPKLSTGAAKAMTSPPTKMQRMYE